MIADALNWDSGPSIWKKKHRASTRWLILYYLICTLSVYFSWCTASAHAAALKISSAGPLPPVDSATEKHDQLPLSRVARGHRNITAAWLAGPTDRYRHGVLGDELEATRLVVETRSGKHLQVDLPLRRVFEDLEPRLADVDGDGRDEIILLFK